MSGRRRRGEQQRRLRLIRVLMMWILLMIMMMVMIVEYCNGRGRLRRAQGRGERRTLGRLKNGIAIARRNEARRAELIQFV